MENASTLHARRLEAIDGISASENRVIASQAGAMGATLDEVWARRTVFTNLGRIGNTFTLPGGTPTSPGGQVWASSVYTFTVPPPPDGARRRPIIYLSGSAYTENFPDFTQGVVYVTVDGTFATLGAPAGGTVPPEWYTTFSTFLVGSIGQSSIEIGVESYSGYSAVATRTVQSGINDIRMVVNYGEIE